METAIRWAPSSTTAEQRFLSVDVTGKTFRLCKVTGFDGKNLEHEVLSTHTKVPAFRAFDWSPVDESLVAVGQSSGDATVLRLSSENAESISFPIRHQRYCNAVSFSRHGLLAAGLDRVRNDFCLNIWDVNQRMINKGPKGYVEPLRKLASSEPITSVKFFRDQPDVLVTGVKGQYVRIYDLRGKYFVRLCRGSVPCYLPSFGWSVRLIPYRRSWQSVSTVSHAMRTQSCDQLA
jgi:WD40 repeat protein